MVNVPPTIGGEGPCSRAMSKERRVSWNRRPQRPMAAGRSRPGAELAADALDSLRIGVVVFDPDDEPIVVNPAAADLGLIRAGEGPPSVHPVLRTLAGQV